ncbi:hypothetical protein DTO166G4_1230 [Paecilomyces variotii]|nr:hypothetical protein DTO166G4_1230 [Paecilomyces variotii]KAJ9242229.1 hypothetical protein DTO166G5_632 [Paecilomyces variotii]KAJ9355266.1 hypothetical protein DTO027B9_4355 [Paecilomyces variotii]KAJ9400028.1 hypothetical protein DTO282F9_3098 [Paecilomyces variotii]
MADIHQVLLGLCESIDDVQHFAWVAADLVNIWLVVDEMEELNLASPSSNCTIVAAKQVIKNQLLSQQISSIANMNERVPCLQFVPMLVPRGMMGDILTNWTKKRIVARILPFSEPRFPYSGYRSTPTANADYQQPKLALNSNYGRTA